MEIRRPQDISALVRDARRSLGLTQKDFAQRLGVSRKWVSEFELGNSAAEIGLVLRALNELGVRLSATTGNNVEAIAPDPISPIDIDTIADMNVSPSSRTVSKARNK